MSDPAELPITYPGFEGRGLALRPAGLLKGAAIVCDGAPALRKGRTFTINDNAGAPVLFQFKGALLDTIPAVQVGAQRIALVRPLVWYEYALIVLPLTLIALGGALGGLCGAAGAYANAKIVRMRSPLWQRIGLALLVTLAAALVWFVLALWLSSAISAL